MWYLWIVEPDGGMLWVGPEDLFWDAFLDSDDRDTVDWSQFESSK